MLFRSHAGRSGSTKTTGWLVTLGTMELQVFSPSSVEDHTFCPRYWQLKRSWTPRYVSYSEVSAAIGTAFAAGAADYNKARQHGATRTETELMAVAYGSYDQIRLSWSVNNRRLDSEAEKLADRVAVLLRAGLKQLLLHDPFSGFTILKVEETIPNAGNARPDILLADSLGPLVADYKCKMNLREQWVSNTLDRYEYSGQMYHYCHFEGCDRYLIALVVLAPKPMIRVRSFAIDPNYKQIWERDSIIAWNFLQLDTEDLRTGKASWLRGRTTQHEKFGKPCEYSRACLQYGLNEDMMRLDYSPKEETPWATPK